MTWEVFVAMILKEGINIALEVFKNYVAGGVPTAEQIAKIHALAQQTATTKMADVLTREGIPLDSPQAIALLALTVPPP